VRRRLLVVVLAASTLVVVAFAVPLALLVRRVAEDRALDAADGDAAALAPVLALTTELDDLEAALARTGTGADGRLAVWLPDGRTVGAPERLAAPGTTDDLALARSGLSFSRQRGDGVDLWTPVLLAGGEVAVIAAHVPDELQRDGVTTSWVALGGVALALVAGSLVVADRLARSLTQDAGELAGTARALAEGRADARASASDTPELADAGHALNVLADRIDELRAAERERVADLSHRLRTPLTALRLEAEATGTPALLEGVDRLEGAVTELVRAARRPLHDGAATATADLTAVVRDRATFWSLLAEEDGRRWTVEEPGEPVLVAADPGELAAALDALLGNVHTHTPPGTPYAVTLSVHGDRAVLAVRDRGAGIADAEAALDRGRSGAGSSGLGLDIAARTAEAAGGALRLDTGTGGTTVILDLPLVTAR